MDLGLFPVASKIAWEKEKMDNNLGDHNRDYSKTDLQEIEQGMVHNTKKEQHHTEEKMKSKQKVVEEGKLQD